jgi:hypothetical protein
MLRRLPSTAGSWVCKILLAWALAEPGLGRSSGACRLGGVSPHSSVGVWLRCFANSARHRGLRAWRHPLRSLELRLARVALVGRVPRCVRRALLSGCRLRASRCGRFGGVLERERRLRLELGSGRQLSLSRRAPSSRALSCRFEPQGVESQSKAAGRRATGRRVEGVRPRVFKPQGV